MSEIAINPAVTPQSRATEKLLKPIRLEADDYLILNVDDEGVRFVAQALSLTSVGACPSWGTRRVVNGVEMWETWNGASWGAREFFSRLPERTFNKKSSTWKIAGTDFNALVTNACWPRRKIVFGPDAEELFDALLDSFSNQRDCSTAAAEFKVNATLPELQYKGADWVERNDLPLSDYQRAAARISMDSDGYALFMDRGTGKTPVAIQRICCDARAVNAGVMEGGCDRPDGGKMLRVLIVCPGQVRLNWEREISRFASLPGKVVVARGGQAKRVRILSHAITPENDCDFSVTIISYGSLVKSIDFYAAVPWDLVISDETHFFKSASTVRFKAMQRIRDAATRRLGLTGTPIGNSPMDLWSQLEFLGKGQSGFMSYKNFRKFHGQWEGNAAEGVERLIGLQNIPLLQERLSRMSFAVTKDEAGLDLPDKVYDVHEVHMTTRQAELYERISRELAVEVEDKLTGQIVDQMVIKNILTMLLRLSQITAGHVVWDAIYNEDGEEVRPKKVEHLDGNPKVEAVVELIQEMGSKSKMLIWCSWVPSIEAIHKRLDELGIRHGTFYGATSDNDRAANEHAFNHDPDFRVMILNPQTAGEGLNLVGYDYENPEESDTYCDHEIFFSSNWSQILRAQAEDRAHRRGTRMPVRITDIVVPGSIDIDILDRIMKKKQMADMISDLSAILKSVLNYQH